MNPTVSILMPAYNASKYIRKAIDSILNQTYSNIELLIADDGSSDNTKDIINSYEDIRIKLFHNEKNMGKISTCDKLFLHCKGDFIAFQDADDYSDLTKIEKQVQAFINDKDLGICGTFGKYIDYKGVFIREKKGAITHQDILEGMANHNQFCGPSIMIRSNVLKEIGGYQHFFDGMSNDDYDWAFRIVEKFKARNIPEVLYTYTSSQGSISRSIKDYRKLFSDKIVRFLARQRKEYGVDSITGYDKVPLYDYIETLSLPYEKDKSLMYREAAERSMYTFLWAEAIKNSLSAVKANPFKIMNYRTLFYCSRKTFMKKIINVINK